MLVSQSLPQIHSPFLSSPLKLSSFFSLPTHKSRPSYPRIKALDLDENTVISLYRPCLFIYYFEMIYLLMGNNKIDWQIVAVSVGVVSIAIGIGIPFFYESQIDSAVSVIHFISFIPFSFFSKFHWIWMYHGHIMRMLKREHKVKSVTKIHHKLMNLLEQGLRARLCAHTERLWPRSAQAYIRV